MTTREKSGSEVTIESIVSAARQLLDEKGLRGFSTRAVARRAGLSPGTVAYYFPKADSLIDAVLDPVHDAIALVLADAMASPASESIAESASQAIVELYRRFNDIRGLVHLRMSTNLTRGTMSDFHGRHNVFPALEEVASYFGDNVDRVQLRLLVQSLSVLAMRYVIHTDEERRSLAGLPEKTNVDGSNQEIEKHLATIARLYVGELLSS